jgi:hypothetical protein
VTLGPASRECRELKAPKECKEVWDFREARGPKVMVHKVPRVSRVLRVFKV